MKHECTKNDILFKSLRIKTRDQTIDHNTRDLRNTAKLTLRERNNKESRKAVMFHRNNTKWNKNIV